MKKKIILGLEPPPQPGIIILKVAENFQETLFRQVRSIRIELMWSRKT